MLPCVRWAATPWGQCHGQCVGSSLATQHRHVYCQDTNGTKVSYRHCGDLQRPISVKNCSTDACALQWRIGPWTQCTASCGRHGFQSRLVTCVHRRTGKATREHHCMWRPRPSSWQRCNVLSCGRGECRDSTRYCDKVRQLELCPLPQFKSRCCHSCRNTWGLGWNGRDEQTPQSHHVGEVSPGMPLTIKQTWLGIVFRWTVNEGLSFIQNIFLLPTLKHLFVVCLFLAKGKLKEHCLHQFPKGEVKRLSFIVAPYIHCVVWKFTIRIIYNKINWNWWETLVLVTGYLLLLQQIQFEYIGS